MAKEKTRTYKNPTGEPDASVVGKKRRAILGKIGWMVVGGVVSGLTLTAINKMQSAKYDDADRNPKAAPASGSGFMGIPIPVMQPVAPFQPQFMPQPEQRTDAEEILRLAKQLNADREAELEALADDLEAEA